MDWTVKFILEVEVGGQIQRRMLIPFVTHHEITESPATSRGWTLGDRPIKEKKGYREATISIAGSSGYKPSTGWDASGRMITDTGPKLFAEFERFLKEYEAAGAEYEGPLNRNAALAPRLVFRSMLDAGNLGHAYYVEIERFHPMRDTENHRLIRSYTLDLITEGPVRRAAPMDFGTSAQQLGSASSVSAMLELAGAGEPDLGKLIPGVTADSTKNEVFAKALGVSSTPLAEGASTSSLTSFLAEVPPRWSQFRSPVQKFLDVCHTVKEVAGVIKTVSRFPRNMVNDIADAADEAIETLQTLWDAIPGTDSVDSRKWFVDAYGGIEDVRSAVLTNIGLGNKKMSRAEGRAGSSIMSAVRAINGTIVAASQLQANETLPQFAFRMLGDAERWREIMELNDMASPYEAADGTPLCAGMSLLVPMTPGIAQTPRDINDLFGADMKMHGREFVLNGTTDYAIVRGQANFEQGLVRRLTNIHGDNEVFPRWGLPPLIGEPGVAGTVGYIAAHVREQIEADHRVKKVKDVSVTGGGDSYDVRFNVESVTGSVTPIIAPMGS